jgi:choline/ethanolamine phosphotransferase
MPLVFCEFFGHRFILHTTFIDKLSSLYQTFDAIDGKQCFRTQDGELEEYADHAVDSISVTLNAILLAAALQLGNSPLWLGANLLLAASAFYAAHWAAHRTHSLSFGAVDVSEAQWAMILIHLTTAIMGQSFWRTMITDQFSLTLVDVVCIASITALVSPILENVLVTLGLKETPLEANGIQIPRRRFSSKPLAPFFLLVAGSCLCIRSELFSRSPVPVLLIIGLSLGKASTRLIFQKLARQDGHLLDLSNLLPFQLFAMQYHCRDDTQFQQRCAWAIVTLLVIDIIRFHAHVASDLKRARGVYVFSRKIGGGAVTKSTGFYVAGGNLHEVQRAWKVFAADEKRVKATYGL